MMEVIFLIVYTESEKNLSGVYVNLYANMANSSQMIFPDSRKLLE